MGVPPPPRRAPATQVTAEGAAGSEVDKSYNHKLKARVVLNTVLTGGDPLEGPTPYPFVCHFCLYWQMIPLSHTLLMHPCVKFPVFIHKDQ